MKDCMAQFMGKSIEDVIETARALGAPLPRNWQAELHQKVHARLAEGVELIPGARNFVLSLREAGIRFCVVSNGSEEKMELMLSPHGLWDEFKGACFSAQTLGIAKPDPGLLRHAIRAMGSPRYPVVIEDSEVGLNSAIAAEVPCLLLAAKGCGCSLQGQAVKRFQTMHQLAEYVLAFEG